MTSATEVVLTRTIRAPRSLVFEAWTQAEHFERWFAPREFTITGVTLDSRPGGRLRLCHHHPSSDEPVWIRGEFIVVDPPGRLVHTLSFADASGRAIQRPGFAFESTVEVTFEERDGVTEVAGRHTGLSLEQGEQQGWTETLDRLARLLERTHGG
jgi:uncharacterized protein YndB with AHSA1/START domain